MLTTSRNVIQDGKWYDVPHLNDDGRTFTDRPVYVAAQDCDLVDLAQSGEYIRSATMYRDPLAPGQGGIVRIVTTSGREHVSHWADLAVFLIYWKRYAPPRWVRTVLVDTRAA